MHHRGESTDYNIFTDSAAIAHSQSKGTDQHSVVGNPKFHDPQKGDYKVTYQPLAEKRGSIISRWTLSVFEVHLCAKWPNSPNFPR